MYRRTIAGLLWPVWIVMARSDAPLIVAPKEFTPRVVMELLGHSQIAITMNTYSHVVPALRRDAANQMDAALSWLLPMPVRRA